MFWFISLKCQKTYRKTPVLEILFLENVARHQVCNFIKKRFQRRYFTLNFAKLLKHFVELLRWVLQILIQPSKPLDRVRRISTFSQNFYFLVFQAPLCSLYKLGTNLFGSTQNFQSNKLYFWHLNVLVFCCAANQYSETIGFFWKIINQSEPSKS